MGEKTAIAWTDHTFNPWWGCIRVSEACTHCYAETFAKRYGHDIWGPTTERRFFGDKHWREPLKWNEQAKDLPERPRVFCASMADVFEDRRDLDPWRARLFDLIERTPDLDWLLLTKRPENMDPFNPIKGRYLAPESWRGGWPEHVWAGTTAEDQPAFDERWGYLESVKAPVRYVSYEPALGGLNLHSALCRSGAGVDCGICTGELHWLIVGGESGAGHRTMDLDWVRSVLAQREESAKHLAIFVKQDSGPYSGRQGRIPDELMVREFPRVEVAV